MWTLYFCPVVSSVYPLFFLAYCQPSQIGCLPYFYTWCVHSANLECRSEMCCTYLTEWWWWRWALLSPDSVAPRRMVDVSASVNLPLHHKLQKFCSGTGSPGWSRKQAVKWLWWWWCLTEIQDAKTTAHHNHFKALFPGPPGWAGARRELLDFMVQGKINSGRHTDHPAGRHSIRTNQCPPLPSPHFLQPGCPSCRPTNSVRALKAVGAFGLGRRC